MLGESEWFQGLCPNAREVRLKWSTVPSSVISFTYPDSFVAMGFALEYGLPYTPKPYHNRVYRVEELPGILREYGFPKVESPPDYHNYAARDFEKFIEVQVWSDAPVLEWMRR